MGRLCTREVAKSDRKGHSQIKNSEASVGTTGLILISKDNTDF